MDAGTQRDAGLSLPLSQAVVLVGNTFPLALVRRRTVLEPVPLATLKQRLAGARLVSFWGHLNTLRLASALIGVDLTPATERPVLTLSEEQFPVLAGETFSECWVLSPDYVPGFRPAIGEEVRADQITGWQVLRITFCK